MSRKIESVTKYWTIVLLVAAGLYASAGTLNAAVIVSPLLTGSSTSDTHFDSFVANDDLINGGQLSFDHVSADKTVTAGSLNGGNDGQASSSDLNKDLYYENKAPVTLTYFLNLNDGTGGSSKGYDITSVSVINGWGGNPPYSHQIWDFQVKPVATLANPTPTFTTLKSVNYDTGISSGPNSSRVVLIDDSTGIIASGIAEVQFVFGQADVTGFLTREIDVVGTPTSVPEPASIGLLAIGAASICRRKRR